MSSRHPNKYTLPYSPVWFLFSITIHSKQQTGKIDSTGLMMN